MAGMSCKSEGEFKPKDEMIAELKASPKEIGAIIMTPDPDEPADLSQWADEALSLVNIEIDQQSFESLMSELDNDHDATAKYSFVYAGQVGFSSKEKLELVYVTEPNDILGNALDLLQELFSEYAGDMPNVSYDVITV